jgi:hypothetical protein
MPNVFALRNLRVPKREKRLRQGQKQVAELAAKVAQFLTAIHSKRVSNVVSTLL